jgi:hypothetical protein
MTARAGGTQHGVKSVILMKIRSLSCGNYLELVPARGRHLHRQALRTVLEQLDPT